MKQTIYRLYTSNKPMNIASQLVTVLVNSTDRLQKLYVHTQLAIAKIPNRKLQANLRNATLLNFKQFARTRKSLTSKNEFESCNEQSYVRTQLAIATMNECRSYKLACYLIAIIVTNTEQYQLVKANSLTSLKTLDSCNEQPYVRTQLAIAKYSSKSSLTSLNTFESCNESYVRAQLAIAVGTKLNNSTEFEPCNEQPNVRTQLAIAMLVKVLQITNVRQAESISEKQERNKFNTVKNYAYLLLTTFADPS